MEPPVRDGDGSDRLVAAVVAVAVLALLVRLVGLGSRPFHWDEARVGYWTLRYLESGAFSYRPVAGGPFLYVVNRHVFALLGATDATARLVVALVGGLSPLAALLYRSRLRDDETLVFAVVLAVSPLLVYYSRFLRGDVPLAVLSLVAVGAVVRAFDTGDRRYLPLAAFATALAFTTSGFVVVTLLCVAVAGVVALDTDRLRGGDAVGASSTTLARLRTWRGSLERSAVVAAVTLLLFYAPRAGSLGGPGLWRPTTFPAVLNAAFVEPVEKFYGVRVAGREGATHELLPFVRDHVEVLLALSLPVVVLGVAAFLLDRYSGSPRSVVTFFAGWAGASLLLFPMLTEVSAPWVAVHTVVPLALPAAVGGATLVRTARRATSREDAVTVATASLVVVAVLAQAGAVTASGVYGPSERSNLLAHYAQPADDLDPLAANVSTAIDGNDGTDVLFYGPQFDVGNEATLAQPPVPESFGERLPLAWYLERAGAQTDSVRTRAEFGAMDRFPPVVVADASERGVVADTLPSSYRATEYRLGLWNRRVVVFVRSAA